MFDQRFGVEVEMNAITRRRASKLASIFFGTGDYDVLQRMQVFLGMILIRLNL